MGSLVVGLSTLPVLIRHDQACQSRPPVNLFVCVISLSSVCEGASSINQVREVHNVMLRILKAMECGWCCCSALRVESCACRVYRGLSSLLEKMPIISWLLSLSADQENVQSLVEVKA